MRAYIGTLTALALLSGSAVRAQQGGFTGSSGGSPGSSGGFTGSSGGFTGSSGGFTGSSGGFTGSSGGFTGSSGGVTGSSGGFTGSSGGFTGSSGGFTGSSGGVTGSSGGFTGSTTGGATGGRAGGTGGTTRPGSTSFLGKHMASPTALGMQMATSGTTSPTTTTNYANTGNSFGQPLYNISNTASVGRTGTTGSTTTGFGSTGLGSTGFGGTGLGTGLGNALANQFRGATSGGVRRAPQYTTQPVFERVAARPTIAAMRPDLHAVLSSSTRLPSAGRIQVTTEGEKVVLRGTVATERERRIAEHMIRMTPGVREVSNELKATTPEAP